MTDNSPNPDKKATVADSIEDELTDSETALEAQRLTKVIDSLEAVKESLTKVDKELLPPSVRERYVNGERGILESLGEAEALHNDLSTDNQ